MTLKDRMRRAGPIWNRIASRKDTLVRVKMVAGAAAGPVACAGVKPGDKLVAVLHHQAAAAMTDLTAEFGGDAVSVAAGKKGNGTVLTVPDSIDNTGGTSTSGNTVVVIWEAYDER